MCVCAHVCVHVSIRKNESDRRMMCLRTLGGYWQDEIESHNYCDRLSIESLLNICGI